MGTGTLYTNIHSLPVPGASQSSVAYLQTLVFNVSMETSASTAPRSPLGVALGSRL